MLSGLGIPHSPLAKLPSKVRLTSHMGPLGTHVLEWLVS